MIVLVTGQLVAVFSLSPGSVFTVVTMYCLCIRKNEKRCDNIVVMGL